MKIAHFADTHLGFSSFDSVDMTGVNEREQDFYTAYDKAIKEIIALKPDIIIHAGDLFHRPSPTNRALICAFEGINKISQSGIPLYIIAGNHELSKTRTVPPIHEVLTGIKGVHVFYKEEYESYEADNYIIHALPHIHDTNEFKYQSSLARVKDKDKINILITHTSVNSGYTMGEHGETFFPQDHIFEFKEFDYVALGHWHNFKHVKEYGNVYYSGSLERVTANELKGNEESLLMPKGFIEADLEIGKADVKFHELSSRTWNRITIDCEGKDKSQILDELKQKLESKDVKDAIVQIRLKDISAKDNITLTSMDIEELCEGAFSLNLEKVQRDDEKLDYMEAGTYDLNNMLHEELKKEFTQEGELKRAEEVIFGYLKSIEDEEAKDEDN